MLLPLGSIFCATDDANSTFRFKSKKAMGFYLGVLYVNKFRPKLLLIGIALCLSAAIFKHHVTMPDVNINLARWNEISKISTTHNQDGCSVCYQSSLLRVKIEDISKHLVIDL